VPVPVLILVLVPGWREPAKLKQLLNQGDALMIRHRRRLRELLRETCACQLQSLPP